LAVDREDNFGCAGGIAPRGQAVLRHDLRPARTAEVADQKAANTQGGDAGERTGDNAGGGHDLSFLPVGRGDVKRGEGNYIYGYRFYSCRWTLTCSW
jgi:hypothetical protein